MSLNLQNPNENLLKDIYGSTKIGTMRILSTNLAILPGTHIDIYSKNVTDHIFQLSNECIPNKLASIRPCETPWMHNELRKLMRKRKRAYDKAKRTQLQQHWDQYKRLRNDTTKL